MTDTINTVHPRDLAPLELDVDPLYSLCPTCGGGYTYFGGPLRMLTEGVVIPCACEMCPTHWELIILHHEGRVTIGNKLGANEPH